MSFSALQNSKYFNFLSHWISLIIIELSNNAISLDVQFPRDSDYPTF